MIFLSYWFVAFALVFFPVFYLVRWPHVRLGILALGCVVFHGEFAGPAGVIPIVILALLTYACALSRRRYLCTVGIIVCIAALLFYKYTRFLAESIAGVLPGASALVLVSVDPVLPELPPLAVSFFVFEFVHYLFDVRGGGAPIRNPLHFGLFAIFWPSLVLHQAGHDE